MKITEETLEHKEKRLKLAHKLFSELLNNQDQYPPKVQQELENKLKSCEEQIKPKYAKLWTKGSAPEGEYIDKLLFDLLVTQKDQYEIFIVDDGDYNFGNAGQVYFNNNPITKDLISESVKTQVDENDRNYIQPREYKLLVFILKNPHKAIHLIELAGKCFGHMKQAKKLKDLFDEEDKDGFDDEATRYRVTISKFNNAILCDINLKLVLKNRKVKLNRVPEYCLLEINQVV